MPYKSKSESREHKGSPTRHGQPKAGVKDAHVDNMEETEELREKYVKDDGNPDPNRVKVSHQNRNRHKPDIDKPAYGSSK